VSVDTATIDGYAVHQANSTFIVRWGGLGTPEVRRVSEDRPWQHGSIEATALWGARVMPVTGWCGQVPGAPDDVAVAVEAFDTLKALLVPGPHEVVIRRPGRTADEAMTVRVASGVELTAEESGGAILRWAVDLVAPDPRLYAVAETTAQRSGAGSWNATNAGTVPTPVVIEVVGPTNAGTISLLNNATSETVSLTGVDALPDNTYMATIDLRQRTVEYFGELVPQDVVAASTNWWELEPGVNSLSVSGTALQAGTVIRARWRSARI
jgi:hypothetical protein